MDFSNIDFITTGAASALGFAIGWGTSWAAGRDAIGQLRARLAARDKTIVQQDAKIREQGREIGSLRAAEQSRREMLSAAGKKGNAASNASRAARTQTKDAIKTAAAKVTRPTKTAR